LVGIPHRPSLIDELGDVRADDARCHALLTAVCANFDAVALGDDAAWGADHRAAAATADAAKHAARGRRRDGAAAPSPAAPDDAFADYTYRRRRPDAGDANAAGAARLARADIETLAKRPALLGLGASPDRRAKKLDKGSGGEIVLEGII